MTIKDDINPSPEDNVGRGRRGSIFSASQRPNPADAVTIDVDDQWQDDAWKAKRKRTAVWIRRHRRKTERAANPWRTYHGRTLKKSLIYWMGPASAFFGHTPARRLMLYSRGKDEKEPKRTTSKSRGAKAKGEGGGSEADAEEESETSSDDEHKTIDWDLKYDEEGNKITKKEPKKGPPDGGYGWVIVAAAFFAIFLTEGVSGSFGILLPYFANAFGVHKGDVTWAGSLLVGVILLGGPFVAAMTDKYGCRATLLVGVVISTFGLTMSCYANSLIVFCLTYGVITGFGFGMLYLPAVVIVGYYFDKKRAMATGIAVCGAGVGSMTLPLVVDFLLTYTNWVGVNVFCSIFTLVLGSICGFLLLPLDPNKGTTRRSAGINSGSRLSVVSVDSTGVSAMDIFSGKTSQISFVAPESAVSEHSVEKVPGDDVEDGDVEEYHPRTSDPDSKISIGDGDGDGDAETVAGDNSEAPSIGGIIYQSSYSQMPDFEPEEEDPDAEDDDRQSRHPFWGGGDDEDDSYVETKKRRKKKRELRRRRKLKQRRSSIGRFLSGRWDDSDLESLESTETEIRLSDFTSDGSSDSEVYILRRQGRPGCCRRVQEACWELNKPAVRGQGCWYKTKEMFGIKLLGEWTFFFFLLANFAGMMAYSIPTVFIVDLATKAGHKDIAVYLLSIIGASNTLGRIALGKISDSKCTNSLVVHNICVFIAGIVIYFVPYATEYWQLAVLCGTYGVFIAAFMSLCSIILVELVGLENLTRSFGLMNLVRGIACIAGSPLAGFIYETTHSYVWPYRMTAILFLTCSLLCFVVGGLKTCAKGDRCNGCRFRWETAKHSTMHGCTAFCKVLCCETCTSSRRCKRRCRRRCRRRCLKCATCETCGCYGGDWYPVYLRSKLKAQRQITNLLPHSIRGYSKKKPEPLDTVPVKGRKSFYQSKQNI